MLYLISLFPVVIFLLAVKALNAGSLAKWKWVGECYLWGAFCCFVIFVATRNSDVPDVAVVLLEELLKCLPILLSLVRQRTAFFAETASLGAASGAGFATLENIMYVYLSPGFSLGDALIRGFGTSLIHMGCTAIFASFALVILRLVWKKPRSVQYLACLMAVVLSFPLHYVYNLFLLPEMIQLIIVVIFIPAIFIGLYEADKALVTKWLDMCVSNEIALLSAIKKGNLRTTRAGEYLMSIKDMFQPEDFFDVCMFLSLHLELNVAAKSNMMMVEAGMGSCLTPEARAENRAKYNEMRSLMNSLGFARIMLLKPILSISSKEYRAMKEII